MLKVALVLTGIRNSSHRYLFTLKGFAFCSPTSIFKYLRYIRRQHICKSALHQNLKWLKFTA